MIKKSKVNLIFDKTLLKERDNLKKNIYTQLSALGLNYGFDFQLLTDVRSRDKYASATI